MAMFYDWRNRQGKGVRPLREQLRELRSPMFIALGILLLVLVAFSIRAYITARHSSVESEKVSIGTIEQTFAAQGLSAIGDYVSRVNQTVEKIITRGVQFT